MRFLPSPPLRALSLLLALTIATTTTAVEFAEHTLTLESWPLACATSTPYAQAVYNTKTGSGRYRVLEELKVGESSEEVARLGWHDEAKGGVWRGVAVEGKALAQGTPPTITLHIDTAGLPWHVEVSSTEDASSGPSYEDLVDGVIRSPKQDSTQGKVRIAKASRGVVPELNRPVVLDKEGKLPEPEVERTFWQKYWWMILGGGVLLMSTFAAPEE